MEVKDLIISSPLNNEEFSRYYDLRWRKLRAPWDQPVGSEKDEMENDSEHVMICSENRLPLGIGRLHFNSTEEAQVRFMAVEDSYDRMGIGSLVLKELEKRAVEKGAQYIVLNSRDTAIPFYEKHGYRTVKQTVKLFGSIPHHVMRKDLIR
jgi:ribosomal protein S18 acetylase RimI-like enzyme